MSTQKQKVPTFVSILGAVTAFIAALTPLYLSYFDNTAEKKADLAYELLSQRVEYQGSLLTEALSEVRDLRYALRLYTLTGALANGAFEVEDLEDIPDTDVDVEALADKAYQLEMVHDLEKKEDEEVMRAKKLKPLPKSLDAGLSQRSGS